MIDPGSVHRLFRETGVLPLLTLDEFFSDNTEEESLAPNQWGYGRPPLADIHRTLRRVEDDPRVAWVRVRLHADTDEQDLAGDSIAVCTTMTTTELERLADTGRLCSDGVVALFDTGAPTPGIPTGYAVLSLVWD